MKLDFLSLATAAESTIDKRASTAASFATTSNSKLLLSSVQAPTKGYYYGSCSGTVGCWNFTTNDSPSGYKQTLDGFGAAVTDATVAVLAPFVAKSGSTPPQVIKDLFGSDGINFQLMRHTVGSSDLTPDGYNYTLDDSTTPDQSLSKFSPGPLGTLMVKFMAALKNYYPSTKVVGSSWSAPGWMKLNGVQTGTTQNNNLNSQYSTSFANYFVKYIQYYKSMGVPIDAITMQNEPLNSRDGFPTMYVDPYQATDLTGKYLGPALKSAGLSTKIWAYDHNTDEPSYPQIVVNGAGSYVGAVAWHCYAENVDWTTMTNFHNSNPSVAQYMTECWTSPTNDWYSTADFCMGPLQNYAAGVIAWNMASDQQYGPHLSNNDACQTCRGLVVVNKDGTYTKTLDYYIMGQFSKFTKPGSIVLDGTGSYDYGNGAKFESVSFLNADKTRTVVIESTFGNDVMATMSFGTGEVWTGLVTAYSVTTWVLPASTGKQTVPATTPPASADIAPHTTKNGATYLNCFGDDTTYRSLSYSLGNITTVEQCVTKCQAGGYSLAGVEYKYQCFCDNYISESPIDKSRCAQYSCTGDSTETCGGDGALQVYQVPSASPSTSSSSSTSSVKGRPTVATASKSSISSSSSSSSSKTTSTPTPSPTSSPKARPTAKTI